MQGSNKAPHAARGTNQISNIMNKDDFKKGMTIYRFAPYNFWAFGHVRQNRPGEFVNTDDITIEKWTVHSSGEKVLRLMDESGKCKTRAFYFNHAEFKNFAKTLNECKELALNAWKCDPFRREYCQLTERNLYF
jgi:hypothetical protein